MSNRTHTHTFKLFNLVKSQLGCLGGTAVRASDFLPSGYGFDSRSGRYQGT